QRLGALEATVLLGRVMEEIDVAVFAFDGSRALRLVNRAGAALPGRPREQLLGRSASGLGLADCFGADAPGVVDLELAGSRGGWRGCRSRGSSRLRSSSGCVESLRSRPGEP